VNQAIGRLLRDGRIAETGPERKGPGSGSGRPAGRLVAVAEQRTVAAIDFGHAHVQVAVADEAGTVIGRRSGGVDVDRSAVEAMVTATDMLADVCRTTGAVVSSVVAGVPGPLDARTGVVQSPTILSSWVQLEPQEELERRLGLPVRVENDAVLGAYGELRRGAGRGLANFLYVKVSHGIGAGIVAGGQLYTGATGIAGEIGHIPLPGRIEPCRCGDHGCLEAVVSVSAVAARIARAVRDGGGPQLPSADVEALSRRVHEDAGRVLGRVLAQLCDLLNPAALVLGGELGTTSPAFLDGVRSAVGRAAQPAIARAVQVRPAALGDDSELFGALDLAAAWQPA
jgi:predicted NBD/HSP70 family sugar kinase